MTESVASGENTAERKARKVREGLVVSDKMDKTVVVSVEDRVKHALYGKVLRRTSKLKAHDEQNQCGGPGPRDGDPPAVRHRAVLASSRSAGSSGSAVPQTTETEVRCCGAPPLFSWRRDCRAASASSSPPSAFSAPPPRGWRGVPSARRRGRDRHRACRPRIELTAPRPSASCSAGTGPATQCRQGSRSERYRHPRCQPDRADRRLHKSGELRAARRWQERLRPTNARHQLQHVVARYETIYASMVH